MNPDFFLTPHQTPQREKPSNGQLPWLEGDIQRVLVYLPERIQKLFAPIDQLTRGNTITRCIQLGGYIQTLTDHMGGPQEYASIGRIAAWIHMYEKVRTHFPQYNLLESTILLKETLVPDTFIQFVLKLGRVFSHKVQPNTLLEKYLHDAWLFWEIGGNPLEPGDELRRDYNFYKGLDISKKVWRKEILPNFLTERFYTTYGIQHWKPALDQANRQLTQLLKEQPPAQVVDRSEDDLKVTPATFYRTIFRAQTTMMANADKKGQILISVNAILISITLTLLGYRSIAQTRPEYLMPAGILLVCCLVSLVYAVLSIRPNWKRISNPVTDVKGNTFSFFGNYINLYSAEQYARQLANMLQQSDAIRDNLSSELYAMGEELQNRYKKIYLAYTVFLLGFICSAIAAIATVLIR